RGTLILASGGMTVSRHPRRLWRTVQARRASPYNNAGRLDPLATGALSMTSVAWTAGLLGQDTASGRPEVYAVVGLVAGLILGALAVWLAMKRSAPAAEPPKPAEPAKPSGAPLRLLALLQREGRLLDFLMEDVQPYTDAQIGAAVRDIHRNSRK